ncbi:MAG TPA: acyl carrier protein [Candidatus Binatia bacterium]|nr:acyl carrier protein [Candidatus Binatia bacterium]
MTASNGLPRERVVELLTEGVRGLLTERGDPVPADLGESTRLIGEHVLSSLELVSVIVQLEETLADDHGVTITIADERAMSQKHSPFRSVGTLADYVCQLLAEQA